MNLLLGLIASFCVIVRDAKTRYAGLSLIVVLLSVYLVAQLSFVSGISSRLDERGFLNLLFAAPVFVLFSKIKFKKRLAAFLVLAPILIPLVFGLSSYYWKYMLGNLAILSAIAVSERETKMRNIIFALSLLGLVATLEKYAVFYLAISIYVSGFARRRPLLLGVLAIAFVGVFYIVIQNSQYGSVEEFLDRRVTRDSYEQAQGDTFLGISDGSRLQIWTQQFQNFLHSPFFGRGFEWQFFDGDVPNHNLLITFLVTFGVVGTILIAAIVILSVSWVRQREFRLCLLGIILISLVGEGVLLPFVVFAVSAQAAIFHSAFLSRPAQPKVGTK